MAWMAAVAQNSRLHLDDKNSKVLLRGPADE